MRDGPGPQALTTLAAGLERIWYADAPPPRVLRPLAAAYGRIAAWRRRRLEPRAVALRARLSAPVVVVGNISVGGAGKTPFVAWLVERLRAQGWRPGVVSRGYGGRRSSHPRRVEPDSDPADVGDEPVLLAQRLNCPVAVAAARSQAALLLVTSRSPSSTASAASAMAGSCRRGRCASRRRG
jgi:tetraacyldisaccharide 4'-kinase